MVWSKLRVRVRANLCNELRDRVDFHVAVYRESHDSDYGRAWITVDGQPIGSWSCFEQLCCPMTIEELRERSPEGFAGSEYDRIMAGMGSYSQKVFRRILSEYLNLDPHIALSAEIPLIRALAVVDKRVGLRTLSRFAIEEEQNALVQRLYQLRIQKRPPRSPAATLG